MLKLVTQTSWQVLDDRGQLLGYVRVRKYAELGGGVEYIARVKGEDIGTFHSLDLAAIAIRSATVSRFSLLEVD